MSEAQPKPKHSHEEYIHTTPDPNPDFNRIQMERRMPYVIEEIKNEVKDIKEGLKENRSFFQERLDRMDNRLWAIVFFCFTTFTGVMIKILIE